MQAENHKRIVKNSLVLYIRMLIMTFVSIFTTRIVLKALGVEDFGIFNIVGGVIGFISMITGALTITVQRYLNFEIGKKEDNRVSDVFSSAIIIHLIIAGVVLLLLETIGYWYFSTSIKIPESKYAAAMLVFHFSAISSSISIFIAPYTALSIAYERMGLFAALSLPEVFLKLIASYLLLLVDTNRLVVYSQFILIITLINLVLNISVWKSAFKEVKFRFKFHKTLFKQLSSFASWSAMGQVSWAFTLQGTNILLNLFFGNILNASYGITSQVNAAITRFVQSFQTAINPQIIKNYARKDYDEMVLLILRGTKYSCYLLIIIVIPVFFEINTILKIWLTAVPDFTPIFCQLMLINCFIDAISNYFATAMQATGRIKKYQIVVSSVLFMNFPLSYLMLKVSNLPYIIFVVYGFISLVLVFIRISFVSKYLERQILPQFFKTVILPILKSLLILLPLCSIFRFSLQSLSSIEQLVSFTLISFIMSCCVLFTMGLNKAEKKNLLSFLKKHIK